MSALNTDIRTLRRTGAAALALSLALGASAGVAGPIGSPGLHNPEAHARELILKRGSGAAPAAGPSGGQNNSVRVVQTGDNNRTLIRQDGNNNAINLQQHGGNNAQVIIQLGDGSRANVRQTGNQSGVLVQFGR